MTTNQTPTQKERTMSDDQVKVVVISDGCSRFIVEPSGPALNCALYEVQQTLLAEPSVGDVYTISVECMPKAEFESLPEFNGF